MRSPLSDDPAMRLARQLAAVLLLPGVVAGVVPALILGGSEGAGLRWGALGGLGAARGATGLVLIVQTGPLFAPEGGGTLAPWDPPRRLVVRGPYRRVRNPMISGVVFIAFGEALLLLSRPHAMWAAAFLVINLIYIPLSEEPMLEARFGEDYREYCRHVGRILP